MNLPLLTEAQVYAGLAMLLLISFIVVAEWFERAIQDDVNEHDGYDEARTRAEKGVADE
jgi:hypothetical protein